MMSKLKKEVNIAISILSLIAFRIGIQAFNYLLTIH